VFGIYHAKINQISISLRQNERISKGRPEDIYHIDTKKKLGVEKRLPKSSTMRRGSG
jgi:hypothetical protein